MIEKKNTMKSIDEGEYNPQYNEETIKALEDVIVGKDLIGPFYSVEEMLKALND